MELQTKRLRLIEVTFAYLENIHMLHSCPETDKYNTLGIPDTIESTEGLVKEWLEEQNSVPRKSYIFSINPFGYKSIYRTDCFDFGKTGKPNFKIAEVWYKVFPDYWSKGFTTEALAQILKFSFTNLGLHKIEAGCAVENIASQRVLEKAGFIQEGGKRKVLPIRGAWVDNFSYAILETDFFENSAKSS